MPKLKVAVAGTSFAANVQIPVFQTHARTEVVAVSSGRTERAQSVARQFGIPAAFTDFDEMLETAKPDLVCISSPPHLHHSMTLSALRRNLHVLCEKPFALDARETREMEATARAAKVVAMVDFEFRFLPARAYLTELLTHGYVGDVRMVEFQVHAGWRARAEDAPWDWWSDEARGGGILGALGSHAVDTLRLWMGDLRRVFGDLAIFVPRRDGTAVTSDDSCTFLVEGRSGARGVVQLTSAAGVDDGHIGVYGSEGQLFIPNYRATELSGGKRADRTTGRLPIPAQYVLPPEDHYLRAPFRHLLNRMVDAIDRGLPSPSPHFADGRASQEILDAVRLSAREGRWVEV